MNLPPEIQSEINHALTVLKAKLQGNIQKILLFGSYATEEYQPDSDIDLAVVLKTLPELAERRKYKRALDASSSSSAHEIDVIFCTAEQLATNEMVFEFINKEGVLLYEQL